MPEKDLTHIKELQEALKFLYEDCVITVDQKNSRHTVFKVLPTPVRNPYSSFNFETITFPMNCGASIFHGLNYFLGWSEFERDEDTEKLFVALIKAIYNTHQRNILIGTYAPSLSKESSLIHLKKHNAPKLFDKYAVGRSPLVKNIGGRWQTVYTFNCVDIISKYEKEVTEKRKKERRKASL